MAAAKMAAKRGVAAATAMTIGHRKRAIFESLRNEEKKKNNGADGFDPAALDPDLKVDVLLHCRMFEEALKEYSNGGLEVLRKIGRRRWFFEAVSGKTVREIEELLGRLSVSARLRLLGKLGKALRECDEAKWDAVFDSVAGNYGISAAARLLHCCTKAKIEAVVSEYGYLRIGAKQAVAIILKSPHVFGRGCLKPHNQNVLRVLASKDCKLFCDILETHASAASLKKPLGKKLTKSFILRRSCCKDKLVAKPKVYVKNFRMDVLAQRLSDADFRRIYLELFPRDPDEIQTSHCTLLLKFYAKRSQRHRLYMDALALNFGRPAESPDLIDHYLLKLVGNHDPQLRETLAGIKLEASNDASYLKYCCTVKQNANNIIEDSVAKLKAENHPQPIQVEHFLAKLLSKRSLHQKLDSGQWTSVLEMTQRIRDVSPGLATRIWLKHAARTSTVPPALLEQRCQSLPYAKAERNPKLLRALLVTLLESRITMSRSGFEKTDPTLLLEILRFNTGSRQPIDVCGKYYPFLMFTLSIAVETGTKPKTVRHAFDLFLTSRSFSGISATKRNETMNLFWYRLGSTGSPRTLAWLLKNDPKGVQGNFEQFLEVCLKKEAEGGLGGGFWRLFRHYAGLGFPKGVLEFFRQREANDSCPGLKKRAIRVLSHVLDAGDFLEYVRGFYKSCDHPTLQAVLASLKNLPPTLILEEILQNQLHRDENYPQILQPLDSALLHLPLSSSKQFLEALQTTPKLQQHVLTSILQIHAAPSIPAEFLNSCGPRTVFRHFTENPSEEVWEVLKAKLEDYHKAMLELCRVPRSFQVRFFEALYGILSGMEDKVEERAVLLESSVEGGIVGSLPTDLVKRVLKTDFLQASVAGNAANVFASSFLLSSTSPDKFEVVFSNLHEFKQKKWHELRNRRLLTDFVRVFADTYMDAPRCDDIMATKFFDFLKETFSVLEAVEEVGLAMMLQFKHQGLDYCAETISDLVDFLQEELGETIVAMMEFNLGKVLRRLDKCVLMFCYKLMTVKKSEGNGILVSRLLPRRRPRHLEELQLYNRVVSFLQTFMYNKVRMHLNLYFKNVEY